MSLFLLTFSRGEGHAPDLQRYEDPQAAMAEFVTRERELRGTNRGVVLLIADDEATLRRTHSHYFEGVEELFAQTS